MRDIFRPHRNPAQLLYDVFQKEAKKRNERSVEEWLEAERQAVWRAARNYAQQYGLRIPLMEEVKKTEQYASGSVDYGAKWAYAITEYMILLKKG